MPKPRPLAHILLVSALIIAGSILFFWQFTNQFEPTYDGTLAVSPLENEVQLRRDPHGLPLLTARSSPDAWFSLGFLHAQERFYQMDHRRKTAQGHLASWMGPDYIHSDLWYRSLNLEQIADSLWLKMPPSSRDVFVAFSDGVNAWVKSQEHGTGIEYAIMGVPVEQWTPRHSLLLVLFDEFLASSSSFRSELFNKVINRFGLQSPWAEWMTGMIPDSIMVPGAGASTPVFDGSEPVRSWVSGKWVPMGFGASLTNTGLPVTAIAWYGPLTLPSGLIPVVTRIHEQSQALKSYFPGNPLPQSVTTTDSVFHSVSVGLGLSPALITKKQYEQSDFTPVSLEVKNQEAHYAFLGRNGSQVVLPAGWLGIRDTSLYLAISVSLAQTSILNQVHVEKSRMVPVLVSDSTSLLIDNQLVSLRSLGSFSGPVPMADSVQSDLYYRFREQGYLTGHNLWDWWSFSEGMSDLALCRQLIGAISSDTSRVVRETLVYLTEWVGDYSPGSIGASLFEVTRYQLFRDWLEPAVGEANFNEWYALQDGASLNGLADQLIVQPVFPGSLVPSSLRYQLAFRDAMEYLQQNFGVTRYVWNWENLNQASMVHPLQTVHSGDDPRMRRSFAR